MRIRKIAQSIGVIGKILNESSTSTTDTYSCDYIDKNTQEIEVFSGNASSGSTITINTTWEELGKFKRLAIGLYNSSNNNRYIVYIPYWLMSTGSNLNDNKRVTNVYSTMGLGNVTVHIIPSMSITTNTISLDLFDDVINSIYVEY